MCAICLVEGELFISGKDEGGGNGVPPKLTEEFSPWGAEHFSSFQTALPHSKKGPTLLREEIAQLETLLQRVTLQKQCFGKPNKDAIIPQHRQCQEGAGWSRIQETDNVMAPFIKKRGECAHQLLASWKMKLFSLQRIIYFCWGDSEIVFTFRGPTKFQWDHVTLYGPSKRAPRGAN